MEEFTMKKWNTPAIAEVNVSETANGLLCLDWESPFDILSHEHKKPVVVDETPVNPTPNPTPVDPQEGNS